MIPSHLATQETASPLVQLAQHGQHKLTAGPQGFKQELSSSWLTELGTFCMQTANSILLCLAEYQATSGLPKFNPLHADKAHDSR